MLASFFSKIRLVVGDQALSRRLLFILAAFVAFRFLATIPIPGINLLALEQFFANNLGKADRGKQQTSISS